jgi:hypothetical protein
MILTIREYQQADFRGFNFLLSSLSPQVANKQSNAANTSFQEALLGVHHNDEATLPFPSFDQESCELKVAKFRAEKKIKDRLLPSPRYFCICFFPSIHAIYVNIPNWMRVYLLKSSGELTHTNPRENTRQEDSEWASIALSRDVVGFAVSILENPAKDIEHWSRLQPLPSSGTMLRLSQFLASHSEDEDARTLMPLWTMNLRA